MACAVTVSAINAVLVPLKSIFSFLNAIPQLIIFIYIVLPNEGKAAVDGLFQFFGFIEFIVGIGMTLYYGIADIYLYVLFGDPSAEDFVGDIIRLCAFFIVFIQAAVFLNYVNAAK
mmetsp:Transcript_33583/g.24617  ORF Transcript_33583/g.24617 Transcript_33583/m.24617 type:complete len:116 (+) Transcript_33583:517-864(+)